MNQKTPKKKAAKRRKDTGRDTLRAVPQSLYCELAGRRAQAIKQQAETYGLPIGGATVDLFEALRAFHDLLADHHQAILTSMASGPEGASLEAQRIREQIRHLKRKSEILEDRLQERRNELIERDEVRHAFGWMAERLRVAGDNLGVRFGREAQELLIETLDQIVEGGGRKFGKPKRSRNDGDEAKKKEAK